MRAPPIGRRTWGHRCDYCPYDTGSRLHSRAEAKRAEADHAPACPVGLAFRTVTT